jgi:hypothetical protein
VRETQWETRWERHSGRHSEGDTHWCSSAGGEEGPSPPVATQTFRPRVAGPMARPCLPTHTREVYRVKNSSTPANRVLMTHIPPIKPGCTPIAPVNCRWLSREIRPRLSERLFVGPSASRTRVCPSCRPGRWGAGGSCSGRGRGSARRTRHLLPHAPRCRRYVSLWVTCVWVDVRVRRVLAIGETCMRRR